MLLRDGRDVPWLQPHKNHFIDLQLPSVHVEQPAQCIATRFFKYVNNQDKVPIYALKWTPDGKRLVAGCKSGEFSLWNGV
jgi:polyadenylation factor subunit 2